MNCHGCKWLDEVKTQPAGNGYCCMIVRSKGTDKDKARFPESKKCELYEAGDWSRRFEE